MAVREVPQVHRREKVVERPIQIRDVYTIATKAFRKVEHLVRKIDQQRIPPAHTAVAPAVQEPPRPSREIRGIKPAWRS